MPSFPWDEYKEREGFTLLHEIVCRISGRDLDSALQSHSADINKLDHKGRSPLQMAIRHRDTAAVRILLRQGADPNICNGMPLCQALESVESVRSVESVNFINSEEKIITKLLLGAGATVNRSAGDKIMAKWIECGSFSFNPDSLAIDKLLVEYGIDIDYQDSKGRTLVMALCRSYCGPASRKRIEQLISYGANVDLRDCDGWTAVHHIVQSDYGYLKTIVDSGARLDAKTDDGCTFLHLAVIYSKRYHKVKMLSEIGLDRLDLDSKNRDGHTAYDLLRKRNGLRWDKYYEKLYPRREPIDFFNLMPHLSEHEYKVILALEALLHRVQDSQGVPTDQQYLPLGEYLSDDKDENPVPGAWPL